MTRMNMNITASFWLNDKLYLLELENGFAFEILKANCESLYLEGADAKWLADQTDNFRCLAIINDYFGD